MPRASITPSYRFALRPRWIALHLLAVAGLAVMIIACFWQLSRLHDKQARNRLYDERAAAPVEAVADVVPVGAPAEVVDGARFRVLEATGRYLPEEEVFVRSRSLDGHPGAWVLTPLALDGRPGEAVVVNRGWIPASDTTPELPAGAEAPAGPVRVTGLLMSSESRGALGAVDAEGVELDVLARADIGRLAEQVDEALVPGYLQLQAQDPPATGDLPAVVPPPVHDEGPHRSYAGQWAIFAVIWVLGYPMLIRRSAIRRAYDALDRARDGDGGKDADGAPGIRSGAAAGEDPNSERDQSLLSFRSEPR